MRIGIYLKESIPERGGSYTFETQILEAFLNLSAQSKHSFIVLNSVPQNFPQKSQNVSFLAASKGNHNPTAQYFKPRAVDEIKKVAPFLQAVRSKKRLRSQNQLAKNLELNLIWSIVPGVYTADIPYITPIFDLQHRLQPYFPEVSRDGEWEKRESSIAPLVSRAMTILTGTEVGKAEIERFYDVPSERIRVIPFPPPTFSKENSDENSDKILEKYKLPERYLLYPAQFWPHKNHANLLLAIFQLKKEYDLTVSIVFVGADKGNLSYLQALVNRYDLSEQIKLLGFVPRTDLGLLYRRAIALTFVSFFGPDNLPPLEAFSQGCPVIAANVPGAQEQLGNAAKLVDPKSATEISIAIKDFWQQDELRQDYIKRGFQRAAQWSAQDYVQQVFQVFDDLEPILSCWQV